jgi:hypothetical protein
MALQSVNINVNKNIDDEWSKFITNNYENELLDDDNNTYTQGLNNEQNNGLNNGQNGPNCNFNGLPIQPNPHYAKQKHFSEFKSVTTNEMIVPEPSEIYVSTKSKIAYLVQPVDLSIFWDIPIIPYATPQNGVIKKQIKLNSKTQEELEFVQGRLKTELYHEQYVISHIDNPDGRIKFKDIRKITIGISKKDIMSYRSKKKQAFYNCFVMILRIKMDDVFREFHIKVFNTGKLEIPGVQSESMFDIVLTHIIKILQPFYPTELKHFEKSDTVLINSNFKCGFYIDREVLFDILRSKYNIQAIYDPCSYPGIQCKFYYNNDIGIQTGIQITTENKDKYHNITEVSFMIFRTGSVLIVGMCDEPILYEIYNFLKELLKIEFKFICQKIITSDDLMNKNKKKKIRKKTIYVMNDEIISLVETNVVNEENVVNEAIDVNEAISVDGVKTNNINEINEDIIINKIEKTKKIEKIEKTLKKEKIPKTEKTPKTPKTEKTPKQKK